MEITTKVMQQATWQKILEDVRAGEAAKYAGTETEITLKDGTTAVLAVAAVNHYKDNELVFVFRDYLSDKKPMNEDGGNAGGWKKSDIRKWLNKEFIKLLPDDFCLQQRQRQQRRRARQLWRSPGFRNPLILKSAPPCAAHIRIRQEATN